MADGRLSKSARPGKAPPTRGLTHEEFEATAEFRRFRTVMRPLMAVSKTELDRMVRATKTTGRKTSTKRKKRLR
jgi:hypothetical protein